MNGDAWKQAVVAAMVEVEMRADHSGERSRLDTNLPKACDEVEGGWFVLFVDPGVTGPDSLVCEKCLCRRLDDIAGELAHPWPLRMALGIDEPGRCNLRDCCCGHAERGWSGSKSTRRRAAFERFCDASFKSAIGR